MPIPAFVEALERCIAELSATVTRTAPVWADHCESPGNKTQFQVLWHVKKAWRIKKKPSYLRLSGTTLAHS